MDTLPRLLNRAEITEYLWLLHTYVAQDAARMENSEN